MATNSAQYSQAVQEYIDTEVEESFAFEYRLSQDEDDPLYDTERMKIDNADDGSE